jgi:hypothetical protein
VNRMVERMSRIRPARPSAAVLGAFLLSASVAYGQMGTAPSASDVASSKAAGNDTIVGVKFLKADHGALARPLKIVIPADCAECVVLHGPFYEGQNAREVFFYLKVPVSKAVLKGISVDVGDLKIRAVVVEKSYLAIHRSGSDITFDMPIQPRDRSSTLELQTSLDWPGITLRVEHAFEDRRAGTYATGPWPAVERRAALNLEFGLREAIRSLGLDREVCEHGLGRIHLMGFDTNDPLGHEDSPPHIHIILRWPHFAGSQAPHFYLSDAGLLKGDVKVTIDGLPQIAETSFPEGAPVPAVDYLGEVLYDVAENADGSLTLRRPAVGSCVLQPLKAGNGGFASGSRVECTTGQAFSVVASDDIEAGVLKVAVDARPVEIYKYDPDTAVLLSAAPSLSANASASCPAGAAKQ